MQKIRLLLFSKYKMVRSAIRLLLSSATDIEIVAAVATIEEVEQAIQKFHPDLLLVETAQITDPIISKIGERAAKGKSTLVVLANEADGETARAMFRAGVTGFVLKHSSEAELVLAIHSAALGRKFLDATILDEITLDAQSLKTVKSKDLLSKRESQVLAKLVQGYTSSEIAKELHLNSKTIETYRGRIYEKLNLRSRADLVRYAVSMGLISVDTRRLA